jgi:hypothetical protein
MGIAERLKSLEGELDGSLIDAISRATERMATLPPPVMPSQGMDMRVVAEIVFTAVGQHAYGPVLTSQQRGLLISEAKLLAEELFEK